MKRDFVLATAQSPNIIIITIFILVLLPLPQ